MRVLHVSDVMGGGVESAVLAMVEATPDVDHHLLHRARAGHDTGARLADSFGSVQRLPADPLRAMWTIRRAALRLFPDVVHAHSSVGGVLVRLAGIDHARVAYSPHCFAFERRDVGRLQKTAYRAVERALVQRTDLLVAVAPSELVQAVGLGHLQVAYALNWATAPAMEARHRTPMEVVTAGRVSAQKDWRYLLHLKRYAERELGLRARWTWLGGGEPEGEQALASAGVEVTGWIPRERLMERLGHAQVYVHTAAWEASPISILEAAAAGLPLAVRSIPSLDSLGVPGRRSSVVGLAERIGELRSAGNWARAQRESLALAHSHSCAIQGNQLRQAYARACDYVAPISYAEPSVPGTTRHLRIPAQTRGALAETAPS